MNNGGQPVTREELREELSRYETCEELEQALARLATKDELGQFVQLFMQEQKKSAEALSAMEQRLTATIRGDMAAQEERLMVEIGRAARVAAEENRRAIGVLDDRYRDLPGRV